MILKKIYMNEVKLYRILIPECYSNKQIRTYLLKYFTKLENFENFQEGDFFLVHTIFLKILTLLPS